MICASCQKKIKGAPVLVPGITKKPWHYCGGSRSCLAAIYTKAHDIWPAALRAHARRGQK